MLEPEHIRNLFLALAAIGLVVGVFFVLTNPDA